MIEETITIVIDGVNVVSKVALHHLPIGVSEMIITSTADGQPEDRKPLQLPPTAEYSDEQMEYDVEMARFERAKVVAEAVNARAKRDRMIVAPDAPVVVTNGPRRNRPAKSPK